MKRLLIFFLGIIHFQMNAQGLKKQTVLFSSSTLENADFSTKTFKFYISQLSFLKNEELVYQENNSFHLIDIINGSNQFTIELNKDIEYDQVQFLLGIDSLTNVSGALDGDLDPTKGMYWAWQSGYINFKLEGNHLDCPSRNNEFEFHLGGYLPPFLAAKRVLLNCTTQEFISIEFNTEEFFDQINFETTQRIMSPGKNAVDLSVICAKQFSIIE